jgi:multidrug efflux system outer membrane protein
MKGLTYLLVTALAVSFLSACELAPTYKTPTIAAPSTFKESAGWMPARPADSAPRGEWWRIFNDDDLNRIEEQVTDMNQNLKEAVARFDEARALAKGARADFYPTVDAAGGAASGEQSREATNSLPHRHYDDNTVGLQASYELDVWGRVRDTARAARDRAQASAGDLAAASLSLHAEAAVDYLTLRGEDNELVVLDDTIATYEKALNLTQARFKAGYAAEPDVAAAEASLETTRTQVAEVRLNRAKLEHAIAILTGQAPAAFSIASHAYQTDVPAVADALPGELLQRRPDVAAAERRVEAANYDIGVARAAFFPTFSLSALIGQQASTQASLVSAAATTWALGASSLLNIFDGGRRRSESSRAHAAFDEAAANYRQTVLNAYGEVEDNLVTIRLLGDENRTQTAAVNAATRAVEQAERRYTAGYANYYDVITSQNIELSAKLTEVQIRYRQTNAEVLLIKALGGGWRASDLENRETVASLESTGRR